MLAEYRKNQQAFQREYDVIINDDGSVYDRIQQMYFDTLLTWAHSAQFIK